MNDQAYTVSVTEKSANEIQALRDRWNDSDYKERLDQFKNSLENNQNYDLSQFDSLEVITNRGPQKLVDLRGVDFRALKIGERDFSFCSFDYALMHGINFSGTYIQYSSFYQAILDGAILDSVQASPIFADNISLNFSTIRNSFFMQSNLHNARLKNATLSHVCLNISNLTNIIVDFANTKAEACEIRNAQIYNTPNLLRWLEEMHFIGIPSIFDLPHALNSIRSQEEVRKQLKLRFDALISKDAEKKCLSKKQDL